MRRWLPHVHVGGSAGECVSDPEGGREGWYVDLCWFGFQLSVAFTSVYAERRLMDEIRIEGLACRPGIHVSPLAAGPEEAQSPTPTTGDSR